MIGLAVLLAIALALLVALFTAMLAWEMRHPPRHTAGYAVARGLAVDPGELGLNYEEWTLERPDGGRLPVWDVRGSPALSASRACVALRRAGRAGSDAGELTARSAVVPMTAVFVHGWGHSRIDALARIAAPQSPFRTMCDRIVFFDLRGHGEANGTSCLGDDEAGDLAALLERLGDGPFVLVGHSMGAVIAMRVAGEAAVAGRTEERTLTPGPSPSGRGERTLTPRPSPSGRGGIVGVIAYGPYLDFHSSLCGRLRTTGYPARPISDLAMLVHRTCGIQPRGLAIDDVQRVACPMLVILGSEDPVASPGDARKIAEVAPDATLIEFAGADHLDAHEVDPSRHDAAVRDFLASVCRRS